jgi:dimethylaniline monooxygenase (N-oxide forming)
VLIVGVGESSADIVTECVHRGAITHWSARSGQWFADRNMGPYPADHITTQGTRVFAGQFGFWEYLVRRFVTGAFVNLAWGRGGHGIPEWTPDTPYLHQFLNKSRDGLLEIYSGRVAPHRSPCRVNGRSVYFEGEDTPVAVDVIILATGYRPIWPFLERQPDALHKLVFTRENPTLAFVGFARPIVGSIPSLSELQARWVGLVWSARVSLPGARRVETETELDAKFHRRAIRDASRLGILQEQELYATDLASRYDANVHWLKLALTWPRAFFVLLISPWAPFKYWFNDPDSAKRQAALQHTIRELPPPRSPSYLLAVGVVVTALMFLTVPAFVFWRLPVAPAIAAVAVIGFLLTCGLRFTERERRMAVRPPGRVREVFPF